VSCRSAEGAQVMLRRNIAKVHGQVHSGVESVFLVAGVTD